MPTPTFTIRLSRDAQESLARVATVLRTTSRSYAREILEVAATGDLKRWELFGREKALQIGEQLAFDHIMDIEADSKAPLKRPTKAKRKGGRHGRSTR